MVSVILSQINMQAVPGLNITDKNIKMLSKVLFFIINERLRRNFKL